jgi:hypothetical protein
MRRGIWILTLVLASLAGVGGPGRPVLAVDSRPGGSLCVIDTDCEDNKCRSFPDGKKYCVSHGKTCATAGGDGASAGKTVKVGSQCFQCAQGLGWRACASQGSEAPAGGRITPNR